MIPGREGVWLWGLWLLFFWIPMEGKSENVAHSFPAYGTWMMEGSASKWTWAKEAGYFIWEDSRNSIEVIKALSVCLSPFLSQ